MTREVTEFDLRAPEFKHPETKITDLEFRSDGKIVRKDRYERGFRSLVEPAGFSLRGFEIDDVVEKIENTFRALEDIDHSYLFNMLQRVERFMSTTMPAATDPDPNLFQDVKDCAKVVGRFADATRDTSGRSQD